MMKKEKPKGEDCDGWDAPYSMIGCGHSVSSEKVDDPLSDLYDGVKEATGLDLRPPPRRIGFL